MLTRKSSKWPARNGILVPLGFMTDQHLVNCIAKIKREGWRLDWLERLEQEQERRKTQVPTPEEAVARIIGEAEEAQWREENVL